MKIFPKILLVTFIASTSSIALADIMDQVEVKLNISTGCEVNGAEVDGEVNKFGTLDFGKTSGTWSNVIRSELRSTEVNSTSSIRVKCDGVSEVPFSVSVDGGLNGNRTLKHVTEADTVAYKLYRDVARTNAYEINTVQKFTALVGEATPVGIYGTILPNATEKAQGDYKDTLLVNVSF